MNTVFLPENHQPQKPIEIAVDIPGKLLDEAEAQLLSFFQNQMFTRERLIENDMVQYDFFGGNRRQ